MTDRQLHQIRCECTNDGTRGVFSIRLNVFVNLLSQSAITGQASFSVRPLIRYQRGHTKIDWET
jgi:hypothetical protein